MWLKDLGQPRSRNLEAQTFCSCNNVMESRLKEVGGRIQRGGTDSSKAELPVLLTKTIDISHVRGVL